MDGFRKFAYKHYVSSEHVSNLMDYHTMLFKILLKFYFLRVLSNK